MSEREAIIKVKTLNEIIENASELPLECQDWLLSIAKGMAFTRKCMAKEKKNEDEQKTAQNCSSTTKLEYPNFRVN